MSINTKWKYLMLLTTLLCFNGCWEFNSNPKKPLKKTGEDDLPNLREVVGQDKIDLLRKYSGSEE